MKHITILALQDASINCIDSSYQMLRRINDFLRYQEKEPFYKVQIAGLEKNISLSHGLYSINTDVCLDEIGSTDMIVVPITCGHFPETVRSNERFREWVNLQYGRG